MLVGATAQQPPDPEQRIILAAAVAEGFLLHSAADLVDGVEAELDDVERIQPGSRAAAWSNSALA